jgi:[ribosomal protein S18]-alanine N-acetyltransferase
VASSPAHLRAYRPSDFETLYRIDQICFPKGIAYGRFELKVYLRSEGTHCVVAETAGEIAGFILTELIVDEAHIITLDVLEDYRRQGIGTLLLSASEEKMTSRGGKRIVLETATTNKAAIALWKKHGYRQLGTIEGYYGWGLDAFRMGKDLVAVHDLGAG